MKATDLWKPGSKPTISFELFPARTEKGAEKLEHAIDVLASLKPDFTSVTFGAGGSTREGSYQLVQKLKKDKKLEVIAYFAGYGLSPNDITGVLDSYKDLGIENILVVRGDEPRDDEDFKPHSESMEHATDLIKFICPKYDFCLGTAGYPEGHIEAKSLDDDLKYLKMKVENGAEYIIANYFYDNKYFFDFIDRCKSAGITVPIIPGIMPIYSVKMMNMLAELCGATITDEIKEGLSKLPEDDKEALLSFGIELAAGKCRALLKKGVPGLHFYTMDKSESSVAVIKQLRDKELL
ncbi:methylenetetrahydrofolate reductase [Spirochaetota bacterium]